MCIIVDKDAGEEQVSIYNGEGGDSDSVFM